MYERTRPLRSYGHHIEGKSLRGDSSITRLRPADGTPIAEFAEGTADVVAQAVDAARRAFDRGPWPHMSGTERSRVLLRLADLIRENLETLSAIEAHTRASRVGGMREADEVSKPIRVARDEIADAADQFEYAGTLAQNIHGQAYTDLGTDLIGLNIREPVGVVGLIVPWNFPAIILAQKLPFALATGCTAVVKPSEFTSGTALEIADLAVVAGVPSGVINVVTGYGDPVGAALVKHPDVDFVSFTGSTKTGRSIIVDSAESLKRVSVELGGKSANIVFADCDIDDALDAALHGIYVQSGECCCSTTRLLVQDEIADEFIRRAVEKSESLTVGHPLQEDSQLTALIHEGHLAKVVDYVELGKQEGATLRTGGKRLEDDGRDNGCYMAPTIFDHVSPEMRIFREEIFGPVLSVTRFSDEAEAMALANDTGYGLANAVWTENIDRAFRVSRALRSGTVWINTIIDGAPQLPFGGYKSSGFGREKGMAGLEEFTEVKSVQIRTEPRKLTY